MKKLYFVIMLCVAALFSANAQSVDEVSVKDLNYRFIGKLPATLADAFTSTDPKLAESIDPLGYKGFTVKGYAFSLTAKSDITIRLVKKVSMNPYLVLLDANYEPIQSNSGSDSGCCVVARLDVGTYYVVALYGSMISADLPYTLTVKEETNAKLMKELTYTPVTNFADTLQDSITVAQPYLLDGREACRAKGYSVQLAAGDLFEVGVTKPERDMYLFLLDKNHNIIALNDDSHDNDFDDSHIIFEVPTAGTYNLVVTTYYQDIAHSTYGLVFSKAKLSSYYIDPKNGDDAGTGITPSRPLKTLDAAVDKSKGKGIYYLMNDYQFGMTGYDIEVVYAKLYPYQKNIRLSHEDGPNEPFIKSCYDLTVGDAQGQYSFTADSITLDEYLFYTEYGTIELNKFKMSQSKVRGGLYAINLKVNNCEFKNNEIGEDLFYISDNVQNSASYIKNTTVKDCQISYKLLEINGYGSTQPPFTVEVENCQFTNNTFKYSDPIWVGYSANLHLKSGAWQYNTLTEVPTDYSFSAKLNKASMAGLYVNYNSTVTLYSGFTMDANNFILVGSTAFVNVVENLNGDKVATILPIVRKDGKTELGYEEGRQVLTGNRSLLNANYQKFALAQMADDIWYLRADGKVYLTPVGIKEDVLANTVIYPNPVTDMATVRIANVEVTDLSIIDAYGRLVMSRKVSGDTETLNLSGLSSGLYFVQFRDYNTILGTQKIIKK